MMMSSVFLLVLAATDFDPLLPDWVRVPIPSAHSRALECGNYSRSWYVEQASERTLKVTQGAERRVEDPIPFQIASSQDRQGDRHVVRYNSGWLVGFDAGEFGGGLWWHRSADSSGSRVRRPRIPPVSSFDFYQASNVKWFARVDDELLVLMGLDHLGGRSGSIFHVRAFGSDVALIPWTGLDGSPYGWIARGRSLLVLTDSSVYELTAPADTRVVHRFTTELIGLYPTSVVAVESGQLYIGMRRYVIRLAPTVGGGYDETWWVPKNCLHFRLKQNCECVASTP
jgi:hypothetical protein